LTIALETTELTKRYGTREVVSHLNLKVHRGDIYGFLGPNGAGKTTTMRMVVGLVAPTAGTVHVSGVDVRRNFLEAIRHVGALIDIPAFYPRLSAYDNLRVIAALRGTRDRGRLEELLEMVGLDTAAQPVAHFSHGMKQRLGIAQALVGEPEILILDEPTTGLDPGGKDEILHLISGLARNLGCTVILSSHLLDEVELICNRMGIIKAGQLLLEGEVRTLLHEASGGKVRIRVSEPNRALAILEGAFEARAASDGYVEIRAEVGSVPLVVRRLAETGLAVYEVIPEKPTLRDLFMRVVRGSVDENGKGTAP